MSACSIDFNPPGTYPGSQQLVLVGARIGKLWIFVRNRDREGWEMPAGHIELDEQPDRAAARELREETGARDFQLHRVSDYQVREQGKTRYGCLYVARVGSLDPRLQAETNALLFSPELPSDLGFPTIQKHLFTYLETAFATIHYNHQP